MEEVKTSTELYAKIQTKTKIISGGLICML